MASPATVLLFLVLSLLLVACGMAPAATQTPSDSPPATADLAVTAAPTQTSPAALSAGSTAPVPDVTPDAYLGEQVYMHYGCNACHSTDGTALVGPTWLGLYGTEEPLNDGSTATVDAQYITESINDPNARIVQGFTGGLMPPRATLGITDVEIIHIIEYMRSLQ